MIGEPDAGKPHVRFDEGTQETGLLHRACVLLYQSPHVHQCSPSLLIGDLTHSIRCGGLRSPTAWTTLENVAVMKQAIQHRTDRRGIAE